MRYRQLGRSGLFVSEICLGAMTFGGNTGGIWSMIGDLDQQAVNAVVGKALESGVNFIDTADVYSQGVSEKLVGQSLKDLGVKRSDVVIATKTFGEMGPGPNDRGASRGHIMDSVKASLERLQTDHIDLYQIHGNDTVTPLDETLRALDDLVSQGLVRYIGCSNWAAWKIAKALGVSDHAGRARFETVQSYYSIAGRDLEREIVPMMASEGVGLMVWSRRPALGQVRPRQRRPAGRAPHQLRLPAGEQGPRLAGDRRDARSGRRARRLGGPRRPGLCAGQALCHHGDHRRAQHRTARGQPRRRRPDAEPRSAQGPGRGLGAALRIPRLDVRAAGR